MSILKTNLKCLIAFSATNEHKIIIRNALQEDFKILYANSIDDVNKYFTKCGRDVFQFIVDLTERTDLCIDFLNYWVSDLALQIIPVVGIVSLEKRDTERIAIDHNIGSITYTPLTEQKIKKITMSVARRYQLNETRVKEAYYNTIEIAKEKLFLVADAIDAGVCFFRIEDEQIYIDYLNNKVKKAVKVRTFEELMDSLSVEEGAKFLSLMNRAKLNYEPQKAIIDVVTDGEPKKHDVTVQQIPNIDQKSYIKYVYKFIVTVVERTKRESYKHQLAISQDLFNDVIKNIDGGVISFTIQDKKVNVDYVGDGIYEYTGYEKGNNMVVARMIPTSTYRYLQTEFYARLSSILAGQEENIFFRSKIICADSSTKHANITIVMKLVNDVIHANCLVLDDTDQYEYALRLKQLSEIDQLTRIPNLKKFIDASEKLFRFNDDLSYQLLVIRIYKFDEILSFFGEERANELLKVIADGIKEYGLKTIKGRVDNKAFALAFIKGNLNEKEFIKNLDEYLMNNFTLYQAKLYYGIYDIKDVYESVETMIIQTTFAVKEIEGNALKNSIYCDSKLKSRFLETDRITSEMKQALDNNEFEVFLQPVFDLKTRKIISAEALTRWHHPKRGYIPPSEYVPIFEENGFIVNIDNFVWESVCKLIRGWLDGGLNAVPVSVNVSRIDLFSIDFYTVITELVKKYNVPVEYFRLEITESAFVLNEKSVVDIVDRLRNYGFKILMDDFGSGYSSLNSLKFINVDFLKIDMDLVKGIEESIKQANILKSVINLGNTLNLELICEGVETENQAEFVEANGCKKAQGWLFSKAIPVDAFNEKMEKN